jgi:hypothetical protein
VVSADYVGDAKQGVKKTDEEQIAHGQLVGPVPVIVKDINVGCCSCAETMI